MSNVQFNFDGMSAIQFYVCNDTVSV